ncbi:ATP-binding protein [Pseudonocardia nigra]|uniref:ATP-binding protein n=1 Tax=Pseudonocardia nigra TaxID=1921578 RepID=UPI001C601627|nr:ATP-binding protein [Pseudonocardia nigra]
MFTLPAIPAAAKTSRVQLRYWLERLRWPADQCHDIEAAVSEAVSNAVEHAYGPEVDGATVTVNAVLEVLPDRSRRVRASVADYGRWRPVPGDLGHRRLGLRLMHGFADHVVINEGDGATGGTEVVLLSAPIPGEQ